MTTTPELCYESLNRFESSKTIAFLSVGPAEGTTTAVVAAANALSRHLAAGVLLIDSNFYHPSLHDRFHISNGKGFSDLVLGPEMPLSEVVHPREGAADIMPTERPSIMTVAGPVSAERAMLLVGL